MSPVGLFLSLFSLMLGPQSVTLNPAEYFQRAEAMESIAARSEGAARWRWLGEAARLYAKDYRGDAKGPIAAQAAFRHARVLSRLGRDGEARGAYLRATELAHEPRLLARARLELAHAARRSGDRTAALDLYLEVILDCRSPIDFLGDAWEWRGKLQQELAQFRLAEISLRAWRACAQTLAEEIRACDRLACLYLDRGHPERAEALLIELEASCGPALDPHIDSGQSLFRRLDKMDARARLRELAWSTQFVGDHDRDRQLGGVAQGNAHLLDPGLPREFSGAAVQHEPGRSRPVGNDLKIAEAYAASPAGAKDLHAGLFGGHARSEVHPGRAAAVTFRLLGWREHPVAQRLAAALKACFKPTHVHQVNSDSWDALWQGNGHRGGA